MSKRSIPKRKSSRYDILELKKEKEKSLVWSHSEVVSWQKKRDLFFPIFTLNFPCHSTYLKYEYRYILIYLIYFLQFWIYYETYEVLVVKSALVGAQIFQSTSHFAQS